MKFSLNFCVFFPPPTPSNLENPSKISVVIGRIFSFLSENNNANTGYEGLAAVLPS